MKTFDILVIGGGPAGIVTATTASRQYKDKSIAIVQREVKQLVPCGIPYAFHLLGDLDKNLMKRNAFNDEGKNLFIGTASTIKTKKKYIELESGEKIGYDKLVLATGSRPSIPDFLRTHRFNGGVEFMSKHFSELKTLKKKIDDANRLIILGSGFTAVEMAEQLAQQKNKDVHLVFRARHCLHRSFSPDLAKKIDDALTQTNIIMHSSSQVKDLVDHEGVVTGIRLADDSNIPGDLVILAMGFVPNTEFLTGSDIKLNENGHVIVDNYLRTNVKDVFAVGDCAQTTGFLTGRTDSIMLASTAAAEARVLGHNLYTIKIKRHFPGTLSVFATELNGFVFASAGVLEQDAQKFGIDYVTGYFEDIDRHPGSIPGAEKIAVKLIAMPEDGQIIGGELTGGKSSAEIINTVALAIQKHVTVYELISFQMGTHPLLNTAPTKSVLIRAAENAVNQILGSNGK